MDPIVIRVLQTGSQAKGATRSETKAAPDRPKKGLDARQAKASQKLRVAPATTSRLVINAMHG